MDWKKLALLATLGGAALGATACGDDGGGGMQLNETQTYVVSTIRIPNVMGSGSSATAAGFNLDGRNDDGSDTSSCVGLTPDYLSSNDSGETGVDNALASLVPTIEMLLSGSTLDETLAGQIADGSLLLIMQVQDIDTYTGNDPDVTVQLFLGTVPGGGAPMLAGATLAPGQTFEGMALGSAVSGEIVNGRMQVEASLLPLMIDTGDIALALNIRQAQVRATLTPTAMNNGAIGGSLRVVEIADAAEMIMPGLRDTVLSVLGGVADMEPQSADPSTCDALSTGILFTAVDAELSGGS